MIRIVTEIFVGVLLKNLQRNLGLGFLVERKLRVTLVEDMNDGCEPKTLVSVINGQPEGA